MKVLAIARIKTCGPWLELPLLGPLNYNQWYSQTCAHPGVSIWKTVEHHTFVV